MEEEIYDVVVIGGGPAGLTAAQYTARADLKTIVLDKSPFAGALGLADKIENYPGLLEPVSGKELLDIFRKQALKFGAEYHETQVIGVRLKEDPKEVYTNDRTYKARAIIIATGAMGRKPTIKGEKEFLGRGVSYCAICDAAFFRDKRVAVLGDTEEAVKEAELLKRFASLVFLISPSKELKVSEEHRPHEDEKLKIMRGVVVKAIEGDEVVERLVLEDLSNGEPSTLQVNGVFVYLHGSRPVVDFLNYEVDLSDEECIITNNMMETNIPGVFAAGDVTCVEVRQVVVAAAKGCIAALSADRYIHGRKRRRYDWKTKA